MAPPSADWQDLLRVQPNDIDIGNEREEETNEALGKSYMKVNILFLNFNEKNSFLF